MSQTIASRELVVLDGSGVAVHCTHHRAHGFGSGDRRTSVGEQPVGIVFLNSLFLPRAATGDSAVYWANAFAKCGYPAFRIDLPGLGDTYAPLDTKLLEFINDGGWESIAAAKVEEVVERFQLSGVVILGHCAGSVSAVFAGAAAKNCKGLLLLDPYFFLPPRMKNSKAWKRLVRWAASNRFGGFLSGLYDRLKKARLTVRGSAPPPNANFPLLQRWKEVAAKRRLPILLFKAPARKAAGTKPRVGEFDYLQYVQTLAGQRSKVTVQLIEGTDHSFANRSGRDAVRRSIENWLSLHFPLSAIGDTANDALQTAAVETRIDSEKHAPCL
jgi:pimeloyl-ACP methyl ester carboxylesterase